MRKILLIEDDELISRCVAARLRCADYEVHVAFDAERGIELVGDLMPDVVLLDVRLPKMDGICALKCLKNDSSTKHIPVIILSASVLRESEAMDAGARYFVRKPFASSVLLSALDAAISKPNLTSNEDSFTRHN